jgi:hypothetical protein
VLCKPRLHVIISVGLVTDVQTLPGSHALVDPPRGSTLLPLETQCCRHGRYVYGFTSKMCQEADGWRERRARIGNIGWVVTYQSAETAGVCGFEIEIQAEGGGITECYCQLALYPPVYVYSVRKVSHR